VTQLECMAVFERLAGDLGYSIPAERLEACETWANLTVAWACAAQLTGVRTVEGVVQELMTPALYAASLLPPGDVSVVDMGCGSGCTSVALWSALGRGQWYLVDRNEKKVTFCRYALNRCRIEGVSALTSDEAGQAGIRAQVVLARALPAVGGTEAAIRGVAGPGAQVLTWDTQQPDGLRTAWVKCGAMELYAVALPLDVSRETCR